MESVGVIPFRMRGIISRKQKILDISQDKVTIVIDDWYLMLTASRNRIYNVTQLLRQFLLATGLNVLSQTIQNTPMWSEAASAG